jgi:hypothetical protein
MSVWGEVFKSLLLCTQTMVTGVGVGGRVGVTVGVSVGVWVAAMVSVGVGVLGTREGVGVVVEGGGEG